jgi:hypothetical protein
MKEGISIMNRSEKADPVRAGWIALTCLAFAACASPNNNHYVIASTGTVIGVEVSQNPANQTPQAKLGYDRAELALVPTSRPPCVANNDAGTVTCGEIKGVVKHVPDVLMELRYGGIFDLGASSGIYQRLAVGQTAVAQPGAALLFAKNSDGTIEPATAESVARANLFQTIDQAEYDAMVDQAKQELGARQAKIDRIVARVQLTGDPSRVDSQKLSDLATKAEINTAAGKGKILTQMATTANLKQFLEQPAKEFVDPLHQALSSS